MAAEQCGVAHRCQPLGLGNVGHGGKGLSIKTKQKTSKTQPVSVIPVLRCECADQSPSQQLTGALNGARALIPATLRSPCPRCPSGGAPAAPGPAAPSPVLGWGQQQAEPRPGGAGASRPPPCCASLLAADLFDILLPMLNIYQEFVRNHQYSLQILAHCKQNRDFDKLLKHYEAKPDCEERTLETFLTYPMFQVTAGSGGTTWWCKARAPREASGGGEGSAGAGTRAEPQLLGQCWAGAAPVGLLGDAAGASSAPGAGGVGVTPRCQDRDGARQGPGQTQSLPSRC